jgi:hypothetical protein
MQLPALSSRRLIGAGAIACAAVLAPVVALAATSSSPRELAGGTPRCTTAGLVVWLNTQGSGTAGSTFYKLKLTNLSGHACTLTGYPGVSGVNLAGHRLGSAAARDHSVTPHTVRLPAGATRTAVLQIVNVGNFSATACHPVTAAGLRVFPPNTFRSKVVPFPFRACSRSGPAYLIVRPVR